MSQYRQRGKKLSPLSVLKILARARGGENIASLAAEFSINRATINRWLLKWGEEAAVVEQLELGRLALQATAQIAKNKAQAVG